VAKVADYVNVMYAGKIVEKGTINEIFYDPRHPYTWGLLSAMPDLDTNDDRLYAIPGSPPNLLHEKEGDAFAPRNKYALLVDDKAQPPMFRISDSHYAATWLLDPRAPKVEMPAELKSRIERMKKGAEIDGSQL
jgi:oligopeptide transport system ATP-binding protein